MRIYVYTEQAWKRYNHPIVCFGIDRSPIRITPDKVKQVLDMAALPGNDSQTFIVVPKL